MGAEAGLRPHPASMLLVPFPAQGHVTPMLQLARALAAHGVAATVAVPDFIHRRIAGHEGVGAGVPLDCIPSGIAEDGSSGGAGDDDTPGFGAIAHAMEHHMPAHLERMLQAPARCGRPAVACVVVDVLASWAVPVAARCGVPAAGFWPAMLASYRVIAAIPELIDEGLISESGTPLSWNHRCDSEEIIGGDKAIRGLRILPAQVELRAEELPWLVGDSVTQKSRFAFWLRTLHRARAFRWVLVNSFPGEAGDEEEDDDDGGCRLPAVRPQILPVGPALLPLPGPSTSTNTKGRSCNTSSSSNPSSMWLVDSSCIGWLDAQAAGSVVYVSFGSWVGSIGADKIRELALGLEATGRPFLWALKDDPSWRAGLPGPGRFADRGKVVAWAPQEDVLAHPAVGCYLTHCGWNSTLEAIRHGVRLLCYPVSGDQFINCAHIAGPWGIGLRLGAAMTRDDVRRGVERVMEEAGEGRCLREKVAALRGHVVTPEAWREADGNVASFVDDVTRERDHPLSLMQIHSVL